MKSVNRIVFALILSFTVGSTSNLAYAVDIPLDDLEQILRVITRRFPNMNGVDKWDLAKKLYEDRLKNPLPPSPPTPPTPPATPPSPTPPPTPPAPAPPGFLPTTIGGVGTVGGLLVVITASGAIIYYEVENNNTLQQIIPNPMDPNLPPHYVGNTYDDDLYSSTPYFDNYWYYSPLNPANWPSLW